MAHSYKSVLIHYIFSTKKREKIITKEIQDRLWKYMGGIAKNNNMKALAIGGVEDHVHLLISLPSTLSIAKAIQLIKRGSSLTNGLPVKNETICLWSFTPKNRSTSGSSFFNCPG